MQNQSDNTGRSADRSETGSRGSATSAGDKSRPESQTTAPAGQPMSPADERLRNSPKSPNELDKTDESQNAADIKRAGEKKAGE